MKMQMFQNLELDLALPDTRAAVRKGSFRLIRRKGQAQK